VINDGTVSVPPSLCANANCGFTAGLLPRGGWRRGKWMANIAEALRSEESSHRHARWIGKASRQGTHEREARNNVTTVRGSRFPDPDIEKNKAGHYDAAHE